MRLVDWIGLISGAISLVVFVYGTWNWWRSKTFVVDRQDPGKPVTKLVLSWEDVRRGLELLVDDARGFRPDLIIGINRGGAIVGGMLAKKLNKPQVIIVDVNMNKSDRERLLADRLDYVETPGRILIADDAVRSGGHLKEAVAFLKAKYPGVELRRVVMLKLQHAVVGPEGESGGVVLDKAAFFTYDGRVKLPWDL